MQWGPVISLLIKLKHYSPFYYQTFFLLLSCKQIQTLMTTSNLKNYLHGLLRLTVAMLLGELSELRKYSK